MIIITKPTVFNSSSMEERQWSVGSSQLSGTSLYQKCKEDQLKKVNNETKSELRDMLNWKEINNKVRDYFLMQKYQLGRF